MIYKLRWLIGRWKVMQHPYEEWYRIKQQVQYRIVDKRWYAKPPANDKVCFNSTYASKLSLSGLKVIVDETFSDIHQFRLLNVIIDDIVTNQRWNHDFKNNKKGQERFVHQIDDFNYELGEIKYVYELSRLYHLPMLMAYAVAKEDRIMIETCINQLIDWEKQNPFLGTTAWKSGNVVGIRIINIIIFRILLELRPNSIDNQFETRLNKLVELHFRFLISHLSLFSSKGNHHLGEIAGIIAICSNYSFKDSDIILKKYWNELQSEILRLIHPDGFNKEQATRYQASYINLFLVAILFGKSRGLELSEAPKARIKVMYDFLADLQVDHTEFFHLGDNDNAELIYPYADKVYNVYESMLNDAVILFSKEKSCYFDLRNYLLWGDEGLKKHQAVTLKKIRNSLCKFYKESGYFIIKDERVQCLFDTGSIGLLPTMSHGHSDILSINLYIDKRPILVDCGSYQYNAHYKTMREYFHGVRAHNTIEINNKDQAVAGVGMFWFSNPKVTVNSVQTSEYPMCEAQHDGYCRKKKQIVHTRRIEYKKQKNYILIKDLLTSKTKSLEHFSFYLHFHPSATVQLCGDRLLIGDVSITNPLFNKGRLERGNEGLPLGWYSSGYDSIEPSYSFVLEMDFIGFIELNTVITY